MQYREGFLDCTARCPVRFFVALSPNKLKKFTLIQGWFTSRVMGAFSNYHQAEATNKWEGVIQCSQKVSFHPETGPEFPKNEKNPDIFGTSLSL